MFCLKFGLRHFYKENIKIINNAVIKMMCLCVNFYDIRLELLDGNLIFMTNEITQNSNGFHLKDFDSFVFNYKNVQ